MYKKLDFQELTQINTGFFANLREIYQQKKYATLKEFLKDAFKFGDDVYFFEAAAPVFKITKTNGSYIFCDEKEKTQINMTDQNLNDLHRFLKDDKKVVNIKKNNKTIIETLFDEFMEGGLQDIADKPYLVYDIETPIGDINNLKKMRFFLGYGVISNDQHNVDVKYKYVSNDNLKKFVDYMLDFDGYIIGYNNVYFDNPVVCHNLGYTDEHIQRLNQKSLDIFLFIWNLTGRRLGLDKVSSSLIGVSKTLSSGLEGSQFISEYEKTGEKKLLTKVQNYCKNDVRMTLGVLLYCLKYQKLFLDGAEISYSIDDMISLGNKERNKKIDKPSVIKGIFDL